MMSLILIITLAIIGIAYCKEGRYGGTNTYDCESFIPYDSDKCRRKEVCDTEGPSYDFDICDQIRYCCPKDLDVGDCHLDVEPVNDQCDVTIHGCNDNIRRLLLTGHSISECTCIYTVESILFCAIDIGPDNCDLLPSCQYTSDCILPGSGCVQCNACGDKSVCFPRCDDITDFTLTTPSPATVTTPNPTTEPTDTIQQQGHLNRVDTVVSSTTTTTTSKPTFLNIHHSIPDDPPRDEYEEDVRIKRFNKERTTTTTTTTTTTAFPSTSPSDSNDIDNDFNLVDNNEYISTTLTEDIEGRIEKNNIFKHPENVESIGKHKHNRNNNDIPVTTDQSSLLNNSPNVRNTWFYVYIGIIVGSLIISGCILVIFCLLKIKKEFWMSLIMSRIQNQHQHQNQLGESSALPMPDTYDY